MSHKQPLYQKALLAWRGELEKQRASILKDKQTKLRDAMHQKLAEICGVEYDIEMEGLHAKDELVLGAVIENLNFLAFRSPAGDINIVLLIPCPRCRHQMTSDPLTSLVDLGRELLQFEMKGTLSDHECPKA
jgi:hypothetical protein